MEWEQRTEDTETDEEQWEEHVLHALVALTGSLTIPEPCPRPLLKLSLDTAPSAGFKLDKFMTVPPSNKIKLLLLLLSDEPAVPFPL